MAEQHLVSQTLTIEAQVELQPLGKELMDACKTGTLDKVKKVISKGCDPNAKTNFGVTALHEACRYIPRFPIFKFYCTGLYN